jgi:hypothetical protein
MWINEGAGTRSKNYTSKFKQRNGEDADPLTSRLDVEAVMLAGEGKRNGRLYIADGSVNPSYIPHLRQLRRGLKPGDPGVERRVPLSVAAVDEIRVCSSANPIFHFVLHCNIHDIAMTQCRRDWPRRGENERRPRSGIVSSS